MKPAGNGIPRRSWLAGMSACALTGSWLSASPAKATGTFPSQPLRLVVPFSAGGATDVLGRMLAKAMEGPLGQSVMVDNRAGASGAIGATNVVQSLPDGYTILMGGVGTNAMLEYTMPDLAYKPERDLASVAYICDVDYVLAVPSDSPYRTLDDLLTDAKKRPDKVRYTSTGPLGPLHIALAYLGKLSGTRLVHVPYKGEAPALLDLLGRRVEVGTMTALTVRPQVETGKLRALATISAHRMSSWPEIPTVAELGFPGFAAPIWNGFFVPHGTPQSVIDKLANAVIGELRKPELRAKLEQKSVTVTAQGPAEYDGFLRAERLRWKKMIAESQVLKS